AQGVVGGAQLQAGDVTQLDAFAVRAALDDDGAELLLGAEAALGVDEQLRVNRARGRLLADAAGGNLDVLFADGRNHLGGGQALGGDLVGIEPDAHGVVARAEDADLADALQAG